MAEPFIFFIGSGIGEMWGDVEPPGTRLIALNSIFPHRHEHHKYDPVHARFRRVSIRQREVFMENAIDVSAKF